MNWLLARWWGVAAWLAVLFGIKGRSLELYRQIVQLEPGNEMARATVGNLQAELGEPAAAISTFVELVELAPGNAEAWFNLGFLYEGREDLDDAERCFRRAVELRPSIDRAWYGLGLVLVRRGRLHEAIDALKKNVELQPFSPYGYYQLAMTYHHLGEAGEAWRIHEKLKGFEPRYAATLKRDLENTPRRYAAQDSSTRSESEHREAVVSTQ